MSINTTSTIMAYVTHTLVASNLTDEDTARLAVDQRNLLYGLVTFLLSLVIIWFFSHDTRNGLTLQREAQQAYKYAYLTKSWSALYGLIAMSYDLDSFPSAFRPKYATSIKQRWHDPRRIALQRLLEKGIIPLYIQDGGISTTQRIPWGWKEEFPYIEFPLYRQAKTRAHFDFLVVRPDDDARRVRFLELLAGNRLGYGVSITPTTYPGSEWDWEELNSPYMDRPLSVGAEGACEVLLPFRPDGDVKVEEIKPLHKYCREGTTSRVPLFRHTHTVVVRVESRHWERLELDSFVDACAERARLDIAWPMAAAWKDANRELRECELPEEY